MNDDSNGSKGEVGFFEGIVKDDGVQRAAAGIVVAIVVAGVKRAIFGIAS